MNINDFKQLLETEVRNSYFASEGEFIQFFKDFSIENNMNYAQVNDLMSFEEYKSRR